MRKFLLLLRKDLFLELRSREMLVLAFALSILLSVIVSAGLANAAIENEAMCRVFPTVLWIVFLFTATLSIERSFEHEREHCALEGLLLLSEVSPASFYLSKLLSNFVFMFLAQIFGLFLLGGLLSVSIFGRSGELLFSSLLVVFGYCSIATLLAAVSFQGRLKGMLLPIILLPLLFPIFFAASEITGELLVANRFDSMSPWLSLIIGLDVLYVFLGINLFGQVVRE